MGEILSNLVNVVIIVSLLTATFYIVRLSRVFISKMRCKDKE